MLRALGIEDNERLEIKLGPIRTMRLEVGTEIFRDYKRENQIIPGY